MNTCMCNSNIDNLNIFNNTTPIPSKVCKKCYHNKSLTEYHKDKSMSNGFRCVCKSCRVNVNKYYCQNNNQVNANKVFNEKDVKICSQCKKQKLYTKFYKNVTKSLGLESHCKDCKANDSKEHFRNQFNKALSKAIKNGNFSCLPFTGCDPHFLKLWFEFQFDDKINWNNYGSYFQIDHVKPCALFDMENENDRRIMNHWSNLSPLEKHENIIKSNKYSDEIELNHTTKILRFLDYLSKASPKLCKIAEESYKNKDTISDISNGLTQLLRLSKKST